MDSIRILTEGVDHTELAAYLKSVFAEDGNQIEVSASPKPSDDFYFTPEAASIIVAGIGFAATLINTLVLFLASKRSGNIVISLESGKRIEIPRNISKEELEKTKKLIEEMELSSIRHIITRGR
jgi:hypothetical protein